MTSKPTTSVRKEGVVNPRPYQACIDCGQPARKTAISKGRCRSCYDISRRRQHGTESCYRAGCRRPECRAAATAARRNRRAAAL